MTNNEAMQRLDIIKDDFEVLMQVAFGSNKDAYFKDIEALTLARGALERRNPAKPGKSSYLYGKIFCCPGCGIMSLRENDRYCSKCGQAVDWSEADDQQKDKKRPV